MDNGLLLVDKPKGWTSFDVVAKVRSILRQVNGSRSKVGHTGTLDPLATGLLVILVGNYTKRANELFKLDKSYEATLKLGETSSTGDEEGEKQTISRRQPTIKEVQATLKQFTGEIKQTPPIYSAIKVQGQRAYKLARQDKSVKLEPRQVTIHSIKLTDYSYPLVKIITSVSSGTYIRTLAEDIGQALGTGAYLTDLKRVQVGNYQLNDAVGVENINLIRCKLIEVY